MFALSERPRNPELQPGELLLLQLVKMDANRLGKVHQRINFALVFDHLERDHDGSISRHHWPNESRTWNWIVYGLATVPTIPFSLEDQQLSRNYQGQDNARYIHPQDEDGVRRFIQWSLAQSPQPDLQLVPPSRMVREFGPDSTLTAILNHDRIAMLRPIHRKTVTAEEYDRNPWLADSLKSYYDHRCQVCGNDFQPTYGVSFSESHHIQYLSDGGPDISGNIVVLCPNHHRVIHATSAYFNRDEVTYEYPNGLRERLLLPTHIVEARQLEIRTS